MRHAGRVLALLFLALLDAAAAHAQGPTPAQPGQFFAWDHDGKNLDHFEVNIDFTATSVWTTTGKTQTWQIPAMSPVMHTFYVRACATADSSRCSDALSMQFVLIDPTLPTSPSNLRIVITLGQPAIASMAKPKMVKMPTRLPTPTNPTP